MRVGKIIKQERIKRGWSQADLGRLLHISKTAVSRWESGEREPGPEIVSRVAAVMELGVDALVDPRQQNSVPAGNGTEVEKAGRDRSCARHGLAAPCTPRPQETRADRADPGEIAAKSITTHSRADAS